MSLLRLRRPVKCVLERFDDMAMTGTRHPFRVDYKVGLDKSGQLLNFDAQLFSNCGHTLDLSKGVMGKSKRLLFTCNCQNFIEKPIKNHYFILLKPQEC